MYIQLLLEINIFHLEVALVRFFVGVQMEQQYGELITILHMV
jgi:hypothetical protein